ncbi:MAG: peptidoglycan DD-metalloendopeptidase family protein [Desulfovibrio sp.]|jgi:murein DD-endopeptidase MepM/ murein hydrolase activator NlpD|nr:peptidoglycan DD-metalloendopeptidase family protein [Desulfovibrio sp.]
MNALAPDASLALGEAGQKDLVRRKMEMDALRRRLGDTRTEGEKLREACEGFEAVFIQKLWEQMRKTVPREGYLHSKDEETYQSLFDVELAKKMASAGGIGLADLLSEQLSRQMEHTGRSTAPGSYRSPLLPVPPQSVPSVPAAAAPLTAQNLYSPLETGEKPAEEESVAQALEEMRVLLEQPVSSSETGAAIREEIAALLPAAAEAKAGPERRSGFRDSTWQGPGQVSAHPKPLSTLGRRDSRPARQADNVREPARPRGLLPQETLWPHDGAVVNRFGWAEDAAGGRRWNPGVTLAGSPGDPVRAILDGTVVFSGPREGYGNTLILEHQGGVLSYYGNVADEGLKPGDKVARGTDFARIAAQPSSPEGEAKNSPLFFEVKRGEMALNPETAIKKPEAQG